MSEYFTGRSACPTNPGTTISLLKVFSWSQMHISLCAVVKEKRELFRDHTRISQATTLLCSLNYTPRLEHVSFYVTEFRNINLIPFLDTARGPRLSYQPQLGPTNPCLIATHKETFPATTFKALLSSPTKIVY